MSSIKVTLYTYRLLVIFHVDNEQMFLNWKIIHTREVQLGENLEFSFCVTQF